MKFQPQMGSEKADQSLLRKAKRNFATLVFSVLFVVVASCKSTKPASGIIAEQGNVTFKIIQLNDVYEIGPLS